MAILIAPNGGVVVVPDAVTDDYLQQGLLLPGVEPEPEAQEKKPVRRRKSAGD